MVQGDTSSLVNVGVKSLNGRENNALYKNLGQSKFADYSFLEGCDLVDDGRGMAISDVDNDGDLDIILNNYLGPMRLLINSNNAKNNWLQLRLTGAKSNRDAIGARVKVIHSDRRQNLQVTSTKGYLSGQSFLLHFGLGNSTVVDTLEVRWPSGKVESFHNIHANRRLELVEGMSGKQPIQRTALK